MAPSPLDLTHTYLHLHQGHAEPMEVDADFWPAVVGGARPLPGWLVAIYDWVPGAESSAGGHSEVHPDGDEFHLCLSGSMRAVVECDQGDEVIEFGLGQTCIVPAGVWHHLVAHEPSRVLSVTFGQGSQHRPTGP